MAGALLDVSIEYDDSDVSRLCYLVCSMSREIWCRRLGISANL